MRRPPEFFRRAPHKRVGYARLVNEREDEAIAGIREEADKKEKSLEVAMLVSTCI